MSKDALLLRLNPDFWPVWERNILWDQDSKIWFKTGRLRPEDFEPGIHVVVLGTSGLGVVARGETTTGVEFRPDPDWRDVAPKFQHEYKQPENRICVSIRRASVPLEALQIQSSVSMLHNRRQTASWLHSEQYNALKSLMEGQSVVSQQSDQYVASKYPSQKSLTGPREKISRPGGPSLAERNLEDFMVHHIEEIEPGLRIVERQLSTPAGRLDLLCEDANGDCVVVELKRTQGTDVAVGQILRYMGWVKESRSAGKVRGIVVVAKKDQALLYAVRSVPDLQVKEFKLLIE